MHSYEKECLAMHSSILRSSKFQPCVREKRKRICPSMCVSLKRKRKRICPSCLPLYFFFLPFCLQIYNFFLCRVFNSTTRCLLSSPLLSSAHTEHTLSLCLSVSLCIYIYKYILILIILPHPYPSLLSLIHAHSVNNNKLFQPHI